MRPDDDDGPEGRLVVGKMDERGLAVHAMDDPGMIFLSNLFQITSSLPVVIPEKEKEKISKNFRKVFLSFSLCHPTSIPVAIKKKKQLEKKRDPAASGSNQPFRKRLFLSFFFVSKQGRGERERGEHGWCVLSYLANILL